MKQIRGIEGIHEKLCKNIQYLQYTSLHKYQSVNVFLKRNKLPTGNKICLAAGSCM